MAMKKSRDVIVSPALDGEVVQMRWEERKRAFDESIREKNRIMLSVHRAEIELKREWRRKTPLVTPHGVPVPQSLAEFMNEARASGRWKMMSTDEYWQLKNQPHHSEEHCAMMRSRLAPLMRKLSNELGSFPDTTRRGKSPQAPARPLTIEELAEHYRKTPVRLSAEAAVPFAHEPLAGSEPF